MIDLRSTKPVRVQFLAPETEEYLASIKGASPKIDMVAYNEAYNEKMEKKNRDGETQMANAASNLSENGNNTPTDSRIVENFAPLQTVTSSDLDKPVKPGIKASNFLISDAQAAELPPQTPAALPKESYNAQQPGKLELPPQKIAAEKEPERDATKEKFIILAGSFTSESNARRLSSSLVSATNHESNVSVDKMEINGKNWWRVHIGPFFDREQADRFLGTVHKMGLPDARISRQK
jgi:cell division septation protein DedD